MAESIDIWKLVAGLGIFLFGMFQLENSLKALAGRTFKLFLKRHTKNKYKAILSGTFVTAVLQSSSVVSLMTLAFVGAGIINMKSALGIIFGSNLGTTFTGWIVATLGFKLNIEDFALPLVGIGGLVIIIFSKWEKITSMGMVLIGFGFLFLGLDYMKSSVDYMAQNFDVSAFQHYGPAVFLLIGFVFTAIVQSSSASMVITLSALSSGIIPFESAAAMVIGADLGTTITALIVGLPGVPAKKRVAMGHFIFNLVTDVVAFLFLGMLIFFVKDIVGIRDDLLGLVFFHSTFNLLGIFIFLPLINYFATFLERRFQESNHEEGLYIHKVTPEIPEAAIEALNNETRHLIEKVTYLNRMAFADGHEEAKFWIVTRRFKDHYHEIKRLDGEIFKFYHELQKERLDGEESSKLNQLILVVNSALHSAKSIKDIEPDLNDFRQSTKSALNELFERLYECNGKFLNELSSILKIDSDHTSFEDLTDLMMKIQDDYNQNIQLINTDRNYRKDLDELELSTVFTVNREIYSASKALITATSHFLLSEEKVQEFRSLPAYKY